MLDTIDANRGLERIGRSGGKTLNYLTFVDKIEDNRPIWAQCMLGEEKHSSPRCGMNGEKTNVRKPVSQDDS